MAATRSGITTLTRRSSMKVALLALGVAATGTLGALGWLRGRTAHPGAIYWFDVDDKRKLVGFASNVFVGRVDAEVGAVGHPTSKPGATSPQTQFAVAVVENIKGRLDGTVTVSQPAGRSEGVLELMEGDPLLIPGQTYLFVTRLDTEQGWYAITGPGRANIRLTDATQAAATAAEFREAYRQEIDPARPPVPSSAAPSPTGRANPTPPALSASPHQR